jgi:hypothetical protein
MQGNISWTNSTKIKPEYIINIDINNSKREDNKQILGYIEKHKSELNCHLWLPERYIIHIHLMLISTIPRMLEISGTELYRNSANIYGLRFANKYCTEE